VGEKVIRKINFGWEINFGGVTYMHAIESSRL